jgi:hypothetical protein
VKIDECDVQLLAALANLDVPAGRRATVLELLSGLYDDISLLEASGLDAEEPAIIFDARWL